MPDRPDIAFDDDGQAVGAVDFDFDSLDKETEPEGVDSVADARLCFDRRQAVSAVLEILTHDATPKQAGQRAFILAHALKLGTCKTQRELAGQLGITPGRVSQLLNTVRRALTA